MVLYKARSIVCIVYIYIYKKEDKLYGVKQGD